MVSMAGILQNTDSLELGRSYTTRLCLISGGSSAPPIQPLPLAALSFHHLLNSFYDSPANLLHRRPSYNYCRSGDHRTTSAAPEAIAQLVLLRWSSHNSCSGGYRTRELFFINLQQYFKICHQLYSPYLPIVVGKALFIFVAN